MATAGPPRLTLIDAVRREIRARHLSIRTEQQYVYWIRGFVRHFDRRQPRQMGAAEVQAYLSMLANERRVSASTHNQALSALLFLYRVVLKQELPWLDQIERPRRPQRLPVVLTVDEVQAVLAQLQGVHAALARLLYGTGMRILEALRLRVHDIDFAHSTVTVREGKGNSPPTCTSRPRRTASGTRSPPICCRPATTYAPSRNFWATPTCAPR